MAILATGPKRMWLQSRRQGNDGGNACFLRPCIRGGVGNGPLRHCAATTCVHGRGRQPWPHDRRRCNSVLGREESFARAGSIRGDRKKLRDVFRCVTTRGTWRRRPRSRLGSPAANRPGTPSVDVAGVLPRRAAGASQHQHAMLAAAWSPASDAPYSDIPALGSSAGCSSEPEIAARSLCKDKFAIPVAASWHTHRFRWYAELVPWEVMTPLGPPGEDDFILLGHSALDPLSLSACQLTTFRAHFPWKAEGKIRRIRQAATTRQAVTPRRKQGRRRSRNVLGRKKTTEGYAFP
jgi:hypothetical protein